MVLIMKKLLIISVYILTALLFSCEEDSAIINCDECLSSEPIDVPVTIRVDQLRTTRTVINVYSGYLEDNILYGTYDTGQSNIDISLPVNNIYTITATYVIEGKTYISVDSAYPRVRYSEKDCEDPCYYVYDNIVNLRLKYTD